MPHDPATLGLDAIRLLARAALIRPDLVIQFSREELRRASVEVLLADVSELESELRTPETQVV